MMGNESGPRFVGRSAPETMAPETMPISADLLEILCCPETKVPVEMLPAEKLAALNERVEAGEVSYVDGGKVEKPLQEALMTTDGKTVYRVDDDIPVMLVDKGIPTRQIGGL